MINFCISKSTGIIVLMSLLALYACTTDSKQAVTLVVHEIYAVEGDDENKKPTVLSYKDVKQYDEDGVMVQQNFYKVDNTLKAYEFIKKDGNKGVTNYYDADSNLLAIYELEYEGIHIQTRTAFDGLTKEKLRSESYERDSNGNLKIKKIFNAQGQLMDVYKMNYDKQDNEREFSKYNPEDKLVANEKFIIVKKNDDGKWVERWGYKNGLPSSFHRRTFGDLE